MVNIVSPKVEIMTPIDGVYICKFLEQCARNCYKSEGSITDESYKSMLLKLIELGHTAMLEHFSITAKLTCDVGVYKDLTRHRCASYAIESTRYCNYSKDKFGNEITVIKPCNLEEGSEEYNAWLKCMQSIEDTYNKMASLGCKPDQMRMILPHSTKADVVFSANIRELRHVFNLRCAKFAHPSVQEIMKMYLTELHNQIPILFDDLYEKYC